MVVEQSRASISLHSSHLKVEGSNPGHPETFIFISFWNAEIRAAVWISQINHATSIFSGRGVLSHSLSQWTSHLLLSEGPNGKFCRTSSLWSVEMSRSWCHWLSQWKKLEWKPTVLYHTDVLALIYIYHWVWIWLNTKNRPWQVNTKKTYGQLISCFDW